MPKFKLTITAQEVFDKLKKQEILVKNISSPLDSTDKDWTFNLTQLADPVNQRPVKALSSSSVNRSVRLNPKTGVYANVTVSPKRGQSKPHKKHIKKTSLTLAPADGVMEYFTSTITFPIALLFDITHCDLKGERYVFETNAGTNQRWWLSGSGGITASSVSIQALRDNNQGARDKNRRPSWNEVLACPSKDSVVGIMIDHNSDIGKKLNAIYRQELVYKHLGRYVPILMMGNSPAVEYTEAEIQADLAEVQKEGKAKYKIAYKFYKLIKKLAPDRDAGMQPDLDRMVLQIKVNDVTQQDYLEELFSRGYLFDKTVLTCVGLSSKYFYPLELAIASKNITFIQKFMAAKQTIIQHHEWTELLLLWLDNPALMTYDELCQKKATLTDANLDYKQSYSKILLTAVQKKHVTLVRFLLENRQSIDVAASHNFFKSVIQVDFLQDKIIVRELISGIGQPFLAEFESQLIQADSKLQLALIKCILPSLTSKDYKDILLKPELILNAEIREVIKKIPIFNIILSDEMRPQWINAAKSDEVNAIVDEILTNHYLFNSEQITANLCRDVPRLHQLTQEGLTVDVMINKIAFYLSKGWDVFTEVAGKTFVETLFEQKDGEKYAIKLIETIPLPESYLLHLQSLPSLAALSPSIKIAVDKTNANDKKRLMKSTFLGKAILYHDEFLYDSLNHTFLQHMIVKGSQPHLIETWLNKQNKIITPLVTLNTKEDILLLALKQKKYKLFTLLFEKFVTVESALIKSGIKQYIETFVKNNEIRLCVEWLNSCPSSFANVIVNGIFSASLFENDNVHHISLLSAISTIREKIDEPVFKMLISFARTNKAINCESMLIDEFYQVTNPNVLYDILKSSQLLNKIKAEKIITVIRGCFDKQDNDSLCDLFERLISDKVFDNDTFGLLLDKDIILLLFSKKRYQIIETIISNNLDKCQKFLNLVFADTSKMPTFWHETIYLLYVIYQKSPNVFKAIFASMSDTNKKIYAFNLLLSPDLSIDGLAFFATLVKQDNDWQNLIVNGYQYSAFRRKLFEIKNLDAIYQHSPDFIDKLFSFALSSNNTSDEEIINIYKFCFSKNSQTQQWILKRCEDNLKFFQSYSMAISQDIGPILKPAFEHNPVVAHFILSRWSAALLASACVDIKNQYSKETLKDKIQVLLALPASDIINIMIKQFYDYLPDDLYPILKAHEKGIELATAKQLLNHADNRVVTLMQAIFLCKFDAAAKQCPEYSDIYLNLLSNSNTNLAECLQILAAQDEQFNLFATFPNEVIARVYPLSVMHCPDLAIKIKLKQADKLDIQMLLEALENLQLPQDQQTAVVKAIVTKALRMNQADSTECSRYLDALATLNNSDILLLLADSFRKRMLNDLAIQCYQFAASKGSALGHYKLIYLDFNNALEHSKAFILLADKNSEEYREQLRYLQWQFDTKFAQVKAARRENADNMITLMKFFMPIPELQERCLSTLSTQVDHIMQSVNVGIIQQLKAIDKALVDTLANLTLGTDADEKFKNFKQKIEDMIKNTRFQETKPIALTEIDEEIKPSQLLARFMMLSQATCTSNQPTTAEVTNKNNISNQA